MSRLLVLVVCIAVCMSGCSGYVYGDPHHSAYVVNKGIDDVVVLFEFQSDGDTLSYLLPGSTGGSVADGSGNPSAHVVVYRAQDCAILADQVLTLVTLQVTIDAEGAVSFEPRADLSARSRPELESRPSACK